ncbi:MAG: 50S ribosomal protein L19e [Candidatus Aenigmarchaeota archaeon]|nr:50S ribosomal protein L19e [Candidatus Aenigmarchaeota archaeon]
MNTQRKIAAKILKCGENRVWLAPSRIADISSAITRRDVKALIKDGAIKKLQKKGISKGRKKEVMKQKKKGRRKGPGSKKGTKITRKKLWIKKIRALRKYLNLLKKNEKITNAAYRDLYKKAKGGFFKNKAHVKIYIERNDLFKKRNQNNG